MRVEQYVMAYSADWDKIKKILPTGFNSLRPVLRINAELMENVDKLAGRSFKRVEFNTPIEYEGKKGWLNLVTWENDCNSVIRDREIYNIPKMYANIQACKSGKVTTITAKYDEFEFLNIEFTGVGKIGGCPKENDNDGTFHLKNILQCEDGFLRENTDNTKFVEVEKIDESKEYCDCSFSWNKPEPKDYPLGYKMIEKICEIECKEILGAYVVNFDRK